MRRAGTIVVALTALSAAGCSSSSSSTSSTAPVTRPAPTTTAATVVFRAHVVHETVVSPAYRQGIARFDGGWVFSVNDALFRADDTYRETKRLAPAIPPQYAARGFNHIGDIDVVGNTIYAPLEEPDYSRG